MSCTPGFKFTTVKTSDFWILCFFLSAEYKSHCTRLKLYVSAGRQRYVHAEGRGRHWLGGPQLYAALDTRVGDLNSGPYGCAASTPTPLSYLSRSLKLCSPFSKLNLSSPKAGPERR